MEFEWHERKRRSNLEKHGIDFWDAIGIFEGPVLTVPDNRAYGEQRYRAIGVIDGMEIVVVYTERRNAIRIISARRANRHERQDYKDYFKK
jgi:uncharacterized DUF497 family protein